MRTGRAAAVIPRMDFRFALRSLWKNPGFSALAVLVTGLGIGANSAVFSVVQSVLLRPLDYNQPGRIVTIGNVWKTTAGAFEGVTRRDWTSSLEEMRRHGS